MIEGKFTPRSKQEKNVTAADVNVDLHNLLPDHGEGVSLSNDEAMVIDPEVTAFISSIQYAGNEAIPLVREEVEVAEDLEIDLASKRVLGEGIGVDDIVEIGKTLAVLEKLKITKADELSVELLQKIKNIEVRLRSIRDQETETT